MVGSTKKSTNSELNIKDRAKFKRQKIKIIKQRWLRLEFLFEKKINQEKEKSMKREENESEKNKILK